MARGSSAVFSRSSDLEDNRGPVDDPGHGIELKAVVVLLDEDGIATRVLGDVVEALDDLLNGIEDEHAVGAPAIKWLGHDGKLERRYVLCN